MFKLPKIILGCSREYINKYLVFLVLHAGQVCSPVFIDL